MINIIKSSLEGKIHICDIYNQSTLEWRNWQTRMIQVHVGNPRGGSSPLSSTNFRSAALYFVRLLLPPAAYFYVRLSRASSSSLYSLHLFVGYFFMLTMSKPSSGWFAIKERT